jgi:hypothetical protein
MTDYDSIDERHQGCISLYKHLATNEKSDEGMEDNDKRLDALEKVLAERDKDDDDDVSDTDGFTDLMDACEEGDMDTVTQIVTDAAAIGDEYTVLFSEDDEGLTALSWSIENKNEEIALLLLDAMAQTDPGFDKRPAFVRAAANGFIHLMDAIANLPLGQEEFDSLFGIEFKDRTTLAIGTTLAIAQHIEFESALVAAVVGGHTDAVSFLLERGVRQKCRSGGDEVYDCDDTDEHQYLLPQPTVI